MCSVGSNGRDMVPPDLRPRFPESPRDGRSTKALCFLQPVLIVNGGTLATAVIRLPLLSPVCFPSVRSVSQSMSGLQGCLESPSFCPLSEGLKKLPVGARYGISCLTRPPRCFLKARWFSKTSGNGSRPPGHPADLGLGPTE